ncbi:MAG TPA: ubiquinol-cytochrome c reductase cytochrome b subunit [Acidimicrobiales bacterium]|jgi:ubiquinol-cytochrome c reductase cytochrome b subunit|nr:ubiquinol-cytochrome c reductase cytochrome b subunit [Acidimicrobiales bacterium]
MTKALFRWFDERLGASHFTRKALDKIFPDHWSFMIGEIAMYCFVILVVTGVYLTFFFIPASEEVVYEGSYEALQGTHMSVAYASSLDISFDVRAGLVMRQMHHWAALIFMAALVVHMCRVFFTAAFRRPREINWVIGVTLFILAMMNGFFGYSLLDDLLSGTGVRVGYSIALSIPVAGEWLAFLFFGGEFPNTEFITRFYILHVLVLPALIAGLLGAHLAILWRQKHTQFKGPGRTEDNIEGSHLWPSYAAKSIGLFFIVTGVLAALGGLVQINPVWLYGPYDPAQASAVTAGSQPDWYVGWLDGALRIFPGWEIRAFGYTVANPFFPGALLPGITFGVLYVWPWLERRFTKDDAPHNLLDRPRDAPVRSGFGAATLSFYTILFVAGGNDVLASVFKVAPESITNLFRILVFVVPVVAFFVTRSACRTLARDKVHPFGGAVGSRVRRTAAGGYEEVDDDDPPKVGAVVSTPEADPYRPPPAPGS